MRGNVLRILALCSIGAASLATGCTGETNRVDPDKGNAKLRLVLPDELGCGRIRLLIIFHSLTISPIAEGEVAEEGEKTEEGAEEKEE